MLKGIPKILSPELLKTLCEMGHSDVLVIGDGNYPIPSVKGENTVVIRMDGHGVSEVLDAILEVFPLDPYVEHPVNLMELMPQDQGKIKTPIWEEYKEIVARQTSGERMPSGRSSALPSMRRRKTRLLPDRDE